MPHRIPDARQHCLPLSSPAKSPLVEGVAKKRKKPERSYRVPWAELLQAMPTRWLVGMIDTSRPRWAAPILSPRDLLERLDNSRAPRHRQSEIEIDQLLKPYVLNDDIEARRP